MHRLILRLISLCTARIAHIVVNPNVFFSLRWSVAFCGVACVQGDLHSYVRVRKRLRESEAKRLFRQMCEVVKRCHEEGIVLRDLKLRKFVFADADRYVFNGFFVCVWPVPVQLANFYVVENFAHFLYVYCSNFVVEESREFDVCLAKSRFGRSPSSTNVDEFHLFLTPQ